MASIPSSYDTPPSFLDVAEGSPISALGIPGAPAAGTYHFSRYFYTPKDTLFNLRIWVEATSAQVLVGRELADLEPILTPRRDKVIETTIYLRKGVNRVDLQLISTESRMFVFEIYQPGKLFYSTTAAGWVYEYDTPVLDVDIPPVDVPDLPVFTILPDWSEPITEQVMYMTEVNPSESDAEGRRRMLRYRPRRSFEAQFLRQKGHRTRMDAFFVGVRSSEFWLPLWHDQYWSRVPIVAASTDFQFPNDVFEESMYYREFRVGDRVLVIKDDPTVYELLRIEAINFDTGLVTWETPPTLDWPAGTRLFPCRLARLLEPPEMAGPLDTVYLGRARFALSQADFRFGAGDVTFPFSFRINRAEDMTFTYDSLKYITDSDIGPTDVEQVGLRSRLSIRAALAFDNRNKLVDFRRWVDAAGGRAKAFMCPTFMNDLEVVDDVLDTFFFDVKRTGLTEFIKENRIERGAIMVWTRDSISSGGYLGLYDITQIQPNGDYDRIFVNGALPGIVKSDITRVSFACPMRFDQDTFEYLHYLDDAALVTTSVVLRSVDAAESGVG